MTTMSQRKNTDKEQVSLINPRESLNIGCEPIEGINEWWSLNLRKLCWTDEDKEYEKQQFVNIYFMFFLNPFEGILNTT